MAEEMRLFVLICSVKGAMNAAWYDAGSGGGFSS